MMSGTKARAMVALLMAGAVAAAVSVGCGGAPSEPAKALEPEKMAESAKPTEPAVPAVPAGETLTSGDFSMVLPLGLQAGAAYVPENNPLSQQKIDLGRKLYFDPRLSKDGTVSCATCHDPDKGFSDGRKTSTGIAGQVGGRNAPTVMNRLFSVEQFYSLVIS